MPAAFSWYLAWRYLVTRWVSLLGVVGVVVAVWALIVVRSIFSGFIGEYEDNIEKASAPLLLTGLAANSSYEELQEVLESDPDVIATAPRILHYAILYPRRRGVRLIRRTQTLNTNPSSLNYVQLLGVDPEAEAKTTHFRSWLANPGESEPIPLDLPVQARDYRVEDTAQPFQLTSERYQKDLQRLVRMRYEPASRPDEDPQVRALPGIVLSPDQMFRMDWILPGQRIDLVSARFTKDGDKQRLLKIRSPLYVSGGFQTNYQLIDSFVALMDLDDLRDMLGVDPEMLDLVTEVAIRPKDGVDLETVKARLQKLVRSRLAHQKNSAVLTWQDQNRSYLNAIHQERALTTLVLYVVMLVAGSLIYATLLMMVTQKIKDIGILTSMGATPGGIGATFVLGGFAVGLFGSLIGAGAGVLTVVYLNPINELLTEWGFGIFPKNLFNLDGIPHRLEPWWVGSVATSAVLLSLVFSLLPARKAAKMPPVLALTHE